MKESLVFQVGLPLPSSCILCPLDTSSSFLELFLTADMTSEASLIYTLLLGLGTQHLVENGIWKLGSGTGCTYCHWDLAASTSTCKYLSTCAHLSTENQAFSWRTSNSSRTPQNVFCFTSFPYQKFPFPEGADVAPTILKHLLR